MQSKRYSCALLLLCTCVSGQSRRVDPGQMYERIYAIVPMIGSGTWADPKRPMFVPPPSQMKPGDRTGIIAFHQQTSDDGKFALVEIVAASRAALAPFTAQLKAQAAQSPGLQVFERGAVRAADIQNAFKAKKKNFDPERFRLVVP